MTAVQHTQISWAQDLLAVAVLGLFVSTIAISLAMTTSAVLCLWWWPTHLGTWAWVGLTALLTFAPLDSFYPELAHNYIRLCCNVCEYYLPTKVLVEDEGSLSKKERYIVALEPHSALPVAVSAVFGVQSSMLPPALRGRTHGMASSICFVGPVIRQFYWWLGLRPITKEWIRRLVSQNHVPLLVPGGVQECLYMQHGQEIVFLRSRKGFIRMAMQTGCSVIPVYAFGQNGSYMWKRPGPPWVSEASLAKFSRSMGVVPMLLLGRWGTMAPLRSPMLVVLGKPLVVPRHDDPPDELVQEHLDKFIAAMQQLFERYKAQAGYPERQLVVL